MATTTPAIISLGSNLGDRRHYLRSALHCLGRSVRMVRVSSIHETAGVDTPPGSPPFLNAVALILATQPAEELLDILQQIETDLGRRRSERNAPRVLDLDLILYGSQIVRSPNLTVPHPRYRQRDFVLAPMRELRLRWIDPITGKSVNSAADKDPGPRTGGRGLLRKLE